MGDTNYCLFRFVDECKHLMISIPVEKKNKALNLLNEAIDKRKVMIKFIQPLTGILNFLNHAIVP